MAKHPGTATRSLEEYQALVGKINYDAGSGVLTWKTRPSMAVAAGSVVGWLSNGGYLVTSHKRKTFLVHRVAWFLHYGELPPAKVDHINGNPLDNRIENLRDGTGGVNEWNRRRDKGKVLPKGVSRSGAKANPYLAQITIAGKRVFLGHFATVDEAHTAYRVAAVAHRPLSTVRFD